MVKQEDQRQPGGCGDHVQIAKVGDKEVGEHKGHGPAQSGQAAHLLKGQGVSPHHPPFQRPQAKVHEGPGQEKVQDGQEFHDGIGQLWHQEEDQEVDRIEEPRLDVAHKGSSAVEVGVPEGDDAPFEASGGIVVDRVEERS